MKVYDLIIVGAGPAGITAGIYAKNFGLDCLIIGEEIGGALNGSYKVDNYPGIYDITGGELMKKFKKHQEYLDIPFKDEGVESINKKDNLFIVESADGEYPAKSLILALGTKPKKLDIKNIDKFENRGVYYQSGNDVSSYKDKVIAVIGGANSAVMKAAKFSAEAKKIYLIYRKDKLRADDVWIKRVEVAKNIEIIYNANVIKAKGGDKLKEIILDNGKELEIESLFVEAGSMPNTILTENLGVKTNEHGFIEVAQSQATNIEGVFAAGDITTGSNGFRQIITACSEGAIAALGALNYLNKK